MNNGKRFKVLAIMSKSDGTGEYFTRVGSAFQNKDASINIYMDLMPVGASGGKGIKLQVRELDERDLQKQRESYSARGTLNGGTYGNSGSSLANANDATPF